MTLSELAQKKLGILGYGQEGKALTRFFLARGLKPQILDTKPRRLWPKKDLNFFSRHKLKASLGSAAWRKLVDLDLVFRSPGIPFLHPKLLAQRRRNLAVSSLSKWFFEHCRAKIIGVTGTKGKGTTASLIYEMIKEEIKNQKSKIKNVYLTGNIGAQQSLEILDDLSADDWVVYELSSFQLQDLTSSPHIGVVLMVTSEHLDHHKSAAEYRRAKAAIVKFQTQSDYAVIAADYPAAREIGSQSRGRRLFFSRKFSRGQNCYVKAGRIYLIPALSKKNRAKATAVALLPTKQIKLLGGHNLENACAAALAANLAGASLGAIRKVLRSFRPLPHRLEALGWRGKVFYYNDSYSTAPESAAAAIQALDSQPERQKNSLIAILGGSKKGANFSVLAQAIVRAKNLKALILIGQSRKQISKAVSARGAFKGKILMGAKNMKEVFAQIRKTASAGDTVVLTPGCASFDMFESYSDRGEQFIKAFQNIRP